MAGHADRSPTVLPPALLLLLTLLFFGPLQIHLTNLASFTIPTLFHALSGAGLALLLLVPCGILLLLPSRGREKAGALLLATAVGLWLQGSILVRDYGPMDGRPIDWGAHRTYGLVDAAVWALLALGAWRWSARVSSAARTMAVGLLLLQGTSLAVTVASGWERLMAGKVTVVETGRFDLSKGRNVVLLVFDELQGDLFPEVLSGEPSIPEDLEGFIHFPDTLAGASFTEIAVPFLMTGELYDNAVPREQFLADAFTRHGISKLLTDRGIDARIYPWQVLANDALFVGPGIAANFRRFSVSDGYREEAREYLLLTQISLFRQAPHPLKRRLYDQGSWGWQGIASAGGGAKRRAVAYTDNNPLLLRLAKESRAVGEGPVFRAHHFAGAHIPLHDYARGGGTVPFGRENYLRVYGQLLAGVAEYVGRLKEIGVYDETMILVLGDHGSGRSQDLQTPASIPGGGSDFPLWKARGMPLLLVKPFGSTGPLRVSRAPASLGDIPRTVAAALGIEGDLPGEDLLRVPEDAARTRRYAAFPWSPRRSDFVSPITLYAVTGPVWLDSSWSLEKVLLPATRR